MKLDEALEAAIRRWLAEDVGWGDVTSEATVAPDAIGVGIIHAKQGGVIAGLPVAAAVFRAVDPGLRWQPRVGEGERVAAGAVLAEVAGAMRSILTGERLALNLLQRLSGIATQTANLAALVADLPARVVDTRKTTPGLRPLEKYAVRVGGGHNHRFGLFDAVLIKDNHIKAAGGITEAIRRAREYAPHTMTVEVEVESIEQMQAALAAGADIIMFDNMSIAEMGKAVRLARQERPGVKLEASGGVRPETIRAIAETGVDIISVGALTHSVQALDISLDLNERKGE